MKKVLIFLLSLILIISFAGCVGNEIEDKPGEEDGVIEDADQEPENDTKDMIVEDNMTDVVYKDGSYDGEGEPWDYGKENATVVIEDGEIFDITLRRLDTDGNEVNYDNWTGETINGKTYPNLKKYREDMAQEMTEKQTWNVDTISSAKATTTNWRLAVKRALEKAKKGE